MKKDVDWAPNKNLEPQSKGDAVAQRANRFIKISSLPKPEKRKKETSILQVLHNLKYLADNINSCNFRFVKYTSYQLSCAS